MNTEIIFKKAVEGGSLTPKQVTEIVALACPEKSYQGKKVLLIVPDATRTAPVGLLFKTIFKQIGSVTAAPPKTSRRSSTIVRNPARAQYAAAISPL